MQSRGMELVKPVNAGLEFIPGERPPSTGWNELDAIVK